MDIDSSVLKQLLAANKNISTLSEDSEEGTILIKDRRIIGYIDVNNIDTPLPTDYIWGITVNPDTGKVTSVKRFTPQQLIDALASEVNTAADSVLENKEAIDEIKIAIDAIKTDLDETVSGFDTSVEQATSSALSDISEAKDEAISALGSKMHVGYRAIIGDGVTKSFTITHNLGSQWVFCQIWFNDLSDKCYYKLQEIDSNSIKIDFDFAPPADSVDVRIVPNVRIEDPTASLPDDFTLTKEHIDDSVECTPEEMQALIAILG